MQSLLGRPVGLGSRVPSAVQAWRPSLGQGVTPGPVTPPGATVAQPPKPPFIDSALVASFIDVTGTIALGMMAYGASEAKNSKLAYMLGIAAGALGFKALADIRNIREK